MNVVDETSKQVGSFFDIMRQQPLSLALVVMNFVLLGYLYYSGTVQLTQRRETVKMIIEWQQATDKLMAQCVSGEIIQAVLKAMEREKDKTDAR